MTKDPLPFVSVHHEKLHEDVARQIARSIVRGDLQPRAQLPSESSLMRQFGVSRAVVREAIRGLGHRSMIETSQGRRTVVRDENDWDTLDAMVLATLREEGRIRPIIRDFLWIRQRIEPDLAAEAAEKMDATLTGDLSDILEQMEALLDSPAAFFDADMAFHTRIAAAVGNRVISRLMTTIGFLFNISRDPQSDVVGALRGSLEWHRDVQAGLIAGDPDHARRAMRGHLEWTAKRLLQED